MKDIKVSRTGKTVRFSTSIDEFGYKLKHFNTPNPHYLGEFSYLGVRQVRDTLSPAEFTIDKMIHKFLSESLIPVSYQTNIYMKMPFTNSRTFFDLLFVSKLTATSYIGIPAMLKRYVDFKYLDKIMGDDEKWTEFKNSFKTIAEEKSDKKLDITDIISRINKINDRQFELFVKACLNIYDGSGTSVDYKYGEYYDPGDYRIEIDHRFEDSLILSRFVTL